MKLKRIVLENLTRLVVAGTTYFEYKPTSDQITIIGTNGTGKSTILNAWTPLPPSPTEFISGVIGKKITEWEHKGDHYYIECIVNAKRQATHTFKKNDEVIIENGTASIITQLCFDHFGVDKDIHELMTGLKLFSTMSANERRDWIMRISGGDFEFVLDLFTKASVGMRDTMGAIKLNRQRLIELEKNRVAPDIIEGYKLTLDNVNKTIGQVLDLKRFIPVEAKNITIDYVFNHLNDLTTKYDRHLNAIGTALSTINEMGIDVDTFVDNSAVLSSEAALHKANLNTMLEDLNNFKEQELLVKESQSLSLLTTELEELNTKIAAIYATGITTVDNDVNYRDSIRLFNDIQMELNSILVKWCFNVPVDLDILIRDAKESKTKLENYIASTQRVIEIKQHRLEHITKQDNIECPKCNHNWKLGTDSNEESTLRSTIADGYQQIIKAQERLTVRINEIETYGIMSDTINEYKRLIRNNPLLAALWEAIHASNALTDPNVSIKKVIDDWKQQTTISIELSSLLKKQQELTTKIDYIKNLDIDSTKISYFKQQLESKIEQQYEIINNINNRVNKTNYVKGMIDKINDINDKVSNEILYIKNITAQATNNYMEQELNTINDKLNQDTYHLNSLIMRSQNAVAVLSDIEQSLEDLVEQHKAYSILVTELSPKEGFVAELLHSFINQMLTDMNAIISALWTYDLEVLICNSKGTDLDFKFPLRVKNSEYPADDIKEGSSSQVDVVNFAFKYVVAQYLGLSDYPFLLDELAPTFDEVHRRNIMHYVRQLVDTNVCSQMVMISHYSETHSAFTKSEYLVTDTFNITVPSVYNTNAIFK